jgi:hypothetical protein
MKNKFRKNREWLSTLVLAGLLLLVAQPVQANGLQSIPMKKVAKDESAVPKAVATRILFPDLKEFESDLHSLFTETDSPFACLRNVITPEDSGPGHHGNSLTTSMDYTPGLEEDIDNVFHDQLNALEKKDFSGFDQEVIQLLKRSEYPCFQDAFYYGPADYQVKELARKVIIQFYPDTTTTGSSNPPPAGNSSPAPSVPPASSPSAPSAPGPSTPATPVAAEPASGNETVNSESPTVTSDPSGTSLAEHPATDLSSASSGGSCSLSHTESDRGFPWGNLGYLFMFFAFGILRVKKAEFKGA